MVTRDIEGSLHLLTLIGVALDLLAICKLSSCSHLKRSTAFAGN